MGDIAKHILAGQRPANSSQARIWYRRVKARLDPILLQMDRDDPEAAELVRAQIHILKTLNIMRAHYDIEEES